MPDEEAADRFSATTATSSNRRLLAVGTRRDHHPSGLSHRRRWLPGRGAQVTWRPAADPERAAFSSLRAWARPGGAGDTSAAVPQPAQRPGPARAVAAPSATVARVPAQAQARAGAPWLIFGIVSISLFMSSLDGTIVSTGLPTLRRALHAGINWTSWTMTAYQLGLVVAMPIAGRVADNFGRKRVFLVAAVLFTSSSLLCGLSNNIDLLIAFRVAQAAGGAAFLPAASGIVTETFGNQSQRALGLFSSIFPLGALVGPIAGGIILATWDWRGMFLVNVPIGVGFTLLAWKWLPSSPRHAGRADVLGAFLMGGALLGLMLAVTDLGNPSAGLMSPSFSVPLLLAILSGWLFLRHCNRAASPLVPPRLLKGRAFAATNLLNLVWGACVIGFGSLVPLFAQDAYHLTPLASGTMLTSRAIGEIVFAIPASMLIYRTGYRIPIIGGIGLIVAGLAMIATAPLLWSPYLWLAIGSTLAGFGTGLSAPAANNASIELAPQDVGAITGLRGAARQGGAILGISIVASVAAHTGHEVATLKDAFVLLAVLLAAMVPLVFAVPAGRRAHARLALATKGA